MERRPTIVDVAREAGVSKSTVSLVLQNSPQVRAETRAAVHRAMARLGYVYNRAAANLRSSDTGLIGLVINDLRNPFFTEFATSVQMTLSARGYATVIANTDENPAIQAQVVRAMIEHGVSALIISPAHGGEALTFEPLARAGIPTLQVLRQGHADTARFPFAAPDYEAGGRLATRHLLEAGARNVAFLGGPEGRPVMRRRLAGYLAALAEAAHPPRVLPGPSTRAFGRQMAARLAREHPEIDAVLCFNDLVALGLLAGCARLGREVGHRFRVVGFDDIEECEDVWPELSSVHCGIAEFGREMARVVLAWLDGTPPRPRTLTPVSLVVRRSSAATVPA